jgi:lipid-A-disaccharide synthase
VNERRVFVSAGETSGDIVGARLVSELRRRDPHVRLFGTGGSHMQRAGVAIASDTSHIGVVGVTEVIRTLPSVVSAYRQIRRRVSETRPDVAVLIGNDGFNVVLARWFRSQRIPAVAYFPPQVWLWRALLGPIARSFDAIATSFPEEHRGYARVRNGADVTFVGHYLADELRAAADEERMDAREALGLDREARVIGLLPGSRQGEIAALAPVLLDAAALLADRDAGLRCALATTEMTDQPLRQLIAAHPIGRRVLVCRNSRTLMRAAQLVLVASGTASLETALIGTPMVIVYKVSAITNLIARWAIGAGLIEKYQIGLPNLVVGDTVVPEVLQERATASTVAEHAWTVLSVEPHRAAMQAACVRVRELLHGSQPIAAVADVVLDWAARQTARGTVPFTRSLRQQSAKSACKGDSPLGSYSSAAAPALRAVERE